jgi:wyosine [tRNA(Phe)-imidazoG37] synthetase (radical SAM superfamily)
VYGPVPSRRLGRSLGIDIIPPFTCTFDCIYCQLGKTKNKVKDWKGLICPQMDDIVNELKQRLGEINKIDFITVSGSGEPTLNKDLGNIASSIRDISDLPLVLITNSSLLWQPDVLSNAKKFDIVMPSLDAGSDKLFRMINRPALGLQLDEIADGVRKLKQETEGQVWLEVMLLKGKVENINQESIRNISEKINLIEPDMVFINTPVRPPCETYVMPPSGKELAVAKSLMESEISGDVEITIPSGHYSSAGLPLDNDVQGRIVRLLSVRPCTIQDLAKSTGLNPNEIAKNIEALLNMGSVFKKSTGGTVYYQGRSIHENYT